MKNVAVILAGCGYLDGAEIRESVLTLLALETEGVKYTVFALNKNQHHVINHYTGEVSTNENRNIIVEAARIARGAIKEVSDLDPENFDALILPGGFGVAKNFSSFAFEGSNAVIDDIILSKILGFNSASKPIGAICISPVLIALAIGKKSPTVTIGTDESTSDELEKLGVKHQQCVTSECVIDQVNKIVSTPAYMDDSANLPDVLNGITKLIQNVIHLTK